MRKATSISLLFFCVFNRDSLSVSAEPGISCHVRQSKRMSIDLSHSAPSRVKTIPRPVSVGAIFAFLDKKTEVHYLSYFSSLGSGTSLRSLFLSPRYSCRRGLAIVTGNHARRDSDSLLTQITAKEGSIERCLTKIMYSPGHLAPVPAEYCPLELPKRLTLAF